MLKKIIAICFCGLLITISCKKEDATETSDTGNTTDTVSSGGNAVDTTTSGGNTVDTTNNGSGNSGTTFTNSGYTFSDDGITCTPFTQNLSINNGIISIVSNQYQGSGSKLDGYFKYQSKPSAGTYTIKDNGTKLGNTPAFSNSEFQMVFHGHANKTWFSTSGTTTVALNITDSTSVDLSWTDVVMTASDSSTVKFSGLLQGMSL